MSSEIEFLNDYVSIYSPTYHERPAAEFLHARFSKWGWRSSIDEVGNVVAECGRGDTLLCFLGHIDTVSGEIPLRLDNNKLFGRGSVDAKGSLAAFACALARCADRLTNLRVRLIGAVEEECSTSKGARYAVEHYERPDFLIIGEPSRWDRLTLGYKGNFHFTYRLLLPRAHGAAEDASPATRAVDCWNQIFSRYRKLPTKPTSAFSNLTGNIRSINSEMTDETDEVQMTVDLRVPPVFDNKDMENWLIESQPDAEIMVHEALPAVRCEKSTPLVSVFLKSIRNSGGQPKFSVKTGTSDMNIAVPAWQCPALAYGPGDSALDHAPNEHIHLDEYSRSIDVFENALCMLSERVRSSECES